jgi:hypothetical protein
MVLLDESQVFALAHHDAMRGVFQAEERIDSILGPRPVFDPVHNHEHGKHAKVLNQRHALGEQREETKRLEEAARAKAGEPVWSLVGKGAVGFIFEALAGILTMYSAGVPFPEDVLFGLALAGLIFALVRYTSQGRGWVRWVAIALLVLVAIAITAVRLDEVGVADGSSPILHFAIPILLLLTTFGIALISEPAIRKLAFLYPDWKKAHESTKKLRGAEAADQAAQVFVDNISRDQIAWDEAWKRGVALYRVTHRAATAEIHGADPTTGGGA